MGFCVPDYGLYVQFLINRGSEQNGRIDASIGSVLCQIPNGLDERRKLDRAFPGFLKMMRNLYRKGYQMSILIVESLYEGLIFGADKNVTETNPDGSTEQSKDRKVLKLPNEKCLFGFVGAAQIAGMPVCEWLSTFTGEFESKTSLKDIVVELKNRVEMQRTIDECNGPAQPLIIHIGGFEKKGGYWVPQIWYIRNARKHGRFGYLDIRKEFDCDDAFHKEFADVHPSEVRKVLKVQAKQFKPFWFHQGIDLFTFNVLQESIKSSFRLLCEKHPEHDIPTTLEGWSKHVCMQVLMYGAYYEAFHTKGKQYVGGGADIITLSWPT